jgi:hypothetical protein
MIRVKALPQFARIMGTREQEALTGEGGESGVVAGFCMAAKTPITRSAGGLGVLGFIWDFVWDPPDLVWVSWDFLGFRCILGEVRLCVFNGLGRREE